MRTWLSVFSLLFLLACTTALTAYAQDAGDGTLRVLRPIIRAEQDVPELCLEFDKPLATTGLGKMVANIRLMAEKKTVAITPKMLDVTGSQMCLTLPQHRVTYRIGINDMRGNKGEKLQNPYSLSFIVPARHPVLAFVNNGDDAGMIRAANPTPLLRAINVSNVKVELFRISDPAHMTEAWMRRKQTSLAASEAATFARTNGLLIWQGREKFDDTPDALSDQPLHLENQTGALPSGLYLVVASAPELRAKETDLAPVASTWVLRSDLRLHALRDDQGLRIFSEHADASGVFAGVHLSVFDQKFKKLAEYQTDANGTASMNPPPAAFVLMGTTDSGDVDFLDLPLRNAQAVVLPPLQATISPDQAFYAPSENVTLTLAALDIHNHAVPIEKSEVRLLRPDHTFYTSIPVATTPEGKATVTFAAPIQNGLWPIIWQQPDGHVLSEMTLRVSANPQAPHLELIADRAMLSQDGEVNLTVKSLSITDNPIPFAAGHVNVKWASADPIFNGWKDFHFGLGIEEEKKSESVAFFITDAKGVAHVNTKLSPPDDETSVLAAVVSVASEPAEGAIDPAPLTLPMKPKDMLVGIKPAVKNGHFAENSLARFDIVALDKDGNAKPSDVLSCHIYELGRSFDWYQNEGTWQYKPQQQQRLIGGDALNFATNGHATVEWPMNAGSYRLDVVDAEGSRLASLDFNSGWHDGDGDGKDAAPLPLTTSHAQLMVSRQDKIFFTLDQPSMITATIADDHIRMLLHEYRQKGVNELAITPSADWGNHLQITVEARASGGVRSGEIILPVLTSEASPPATIQRAAQKSAAVPAAIYDENLFLTDAAQRILTQQQSWSAPAGHAVLLGVAQMDGVPSALSATIYQTPFSTHDVSEWLQVTALWHEAIVASKLMSEPNLRQRQDEMIARLIARQKPDGSIAPEPDEAGDMLSTAEALQAFALYKNAALKPVIDFTADNLRRRLDNIWFDEKERDDRVAAYAALASAGQADWTKLHYFSDSSTDKNLSPLSALRLSAALAKVGDKEKSLVWINAAAVQRKSNDLDAALLPLLAENANFDTADMQPALTQLGKTLQQKSENIGTQALFLKAMWFVQNRAPVWHAVINGADTMAKNIAALPALPHTANVIRNQGNQPLHVLEANVTKESQSASGISRHIYRPEGGEVTGNFQIGNTYLVLLELNLPAKSGMAYLLRDEVSPSLSPSTCLLQNTGNNASFVWMPELTAAKRCETSTHAIEAIVATNNKSSVYHFAYLARAEGSRKSNMRPPVLRGKPNLIGTL